MGRELPARPTLFAKFADTLTGPADAVPAVAEDPGMDWEGELAVVGRTAYKVREERRTSTSPVSRWPTTSPCGGGSTARRSGCRARSGHVPLPST
ncbi:fumarylacetoacetate hydrolase family protein [Streptomyces sp. NPDC087568]|uniref:fumarylacetoacetate hydrolase family protein n=1 Tax=Streptomyces sp. NPDC087568 TaxID=3365799 RepID=UPI00380303FE